MVYDVTCLESLRELVQQISSVARYVAPPAHAHVPTSAFFLVGNKSDRSDVAVSPANVTDAAVAIAGALDVDVAAIGPPVFTSARTAENVELAFHALAAKCIADARRSQAAARGGADAPIVLAARPGRKSACAQCAVT